MKNKKIMIIAVIVVILVGIIMTATIGFNKSMEYKSGTRIEVSLQSGYDKKDVETIVKECFPNKKYDIQDVEEMNQVVSIKLNEYSEEELDNFKSKICEKYEIEKDNLSLYEIAVPATRIRTIVSPYVWPVTMATVISLLYVGIRNIKENKVIKSIAKVFVTLLIVAGLFFSIIVITRIPFSNYTMPIALMIYLITMIICSVKK